MNTIESDLRRGRNGVGGNDSNGAAFGGESENINVKDLARFEAHANDRYRREQLPPNFEKAVRRASAALACIFLSLSIPHSMHEENRRDEKPASEKRLMCSSIAYYSCDKRDADARADRS